MSFVVPTVFKAIDKYSSTLDKMSRNTSAFASKVEAAAARIDRRFTRIGEVASDISRKGAVVGIALAAPLILAAREAVKFEDKMADVAKTTGLKGAELEKFGKGILSIGKGTRTSIDDLQKIGEIGGQLGIPKEELLSFTEAANKFNVALGKDFLGGTEEAITSISKIKGLFPETRGLDISSAITKSGSAINELGAAGAATSANITDFTLRIGAMPDKLKPGLQATQALAAYLEESGIQSEISARGVSDFFLTAAQNMGKFSAQMGMSNEAAKELFTNDKLAFAKKFAASLNKLDDVKLAKKLKEDFKLGDIGVLKVVGALGNGVERLTKLEELANKAFAEGTSLQMEYVTKNSTTAARLAIAENNFRVLGITIGTKLLPQLNKVLDKLIPLIDRTIAWTERNPELTKTLLKGAIALSGFLLAVSGISTIVAGVSGAITGVTATIGAILSPVGLLVSGFLGLMGAAYELIKNWEDWGAAITAVGAIAAAFFSPFLLGAGLILSAVQSIYKNWHMLEDAFTNGNFINVLYSLAWILTDMILYPIQQIFELISRIPGAFQAKFAAQGIEKFRGFMGADIAPRAQEDKESHLPFVDLKGARDNSLREIIERNNNQNVQVDINNNNNSRVSVNPGMGAIPIKTTSTQTYGQ